MPLWVRKILIYSKIQDSSLTLLALAAHYYSGPFKAKEILSDGVQSQLLISSQSKSDRAIYPATPHPVHLFSSPKWG